MTELYRFQREGVRKIDYFNGRVLLADEMGLGKTLESLWWAKHYLPSNAKIVVVCPASIKVNWQREAKFHVGIRAEILNTFTPYYRLPPARMFIINYDILAGRKTQERWWLHLLTEWEPDLVILDETHYIKSRTTKRTKAVTALCEEVPHIIAMSGTPLTNRPSELFNVLKILHPDEFPSYTQFCWRYCNPRVTPWGLDVSGASNLKELHKRLSDLCMIRRRKSEVLKQLPPKTTSVIPIELAEKDKREYNTAEREFIQWLRRISPERARRAEKAEYLVKRGYLKRLAGILKLKLVMEYIQNFLEESTEKLIFFGIHKDFLWPIYDRFREQAVIVTGKVPRRKRQQAFDKFVKRKSCRLFIGNVQAAGVGWNGQVACNVAFGELPWTPGELSQAEDRAHRIGQKNKVMCTYLVSQGTIEEDLCRIIQEKQATLSSVLDGEVDPEFDIMTKLEQALLAKHKRNK